MKAELAEAKLKEASLVEEIKFWNMRFYGSKSEKVAHGQISLFNEMEAAFDEEHPEPSIEDALPKRKGKPHRRGGKVNIDYDRFKTIVIEHDIPEGERACPGVRLRAQGDERRGHQAPQDRPRPDLRRGAPPPRLQVRGLLRRERQGRGEEVRDREGAAAQAAHPGLLRHAVADLLRHQRQVLPGPAAVPHGGRVQVHARRDRGRTWPAGS